MYPPITLGRQAGGWIDEITEWPDEKKSVCLSLQKGSEGIRYPMVVTVDGTMTAMVVGVVHLMTTNGGNRGDGDGYWQ